MPEVERGAVERLVVVDGELTGQLDLVETRLLAPLAGLGTADAGAAAPASAEVLPGTVPGVLAGVLPGVLADRAGALAALRRLRAAVSGAEVRGPRVWAPNGRWEHAGLRLVRLPAADVDLLYAALRELSAALAAPAAAGGGLTRLLGRLAEATGETPAALVGALARSLAAVDLVPDADTAELARALRASDGDDIRLTAEQEEAWQRLAHRVTMLLTEAVPLHRFLG
ncbi:hypothetical protein [Peterkaempfera bronchialis]|uniref:hypothetical protein n=1 Tax=Peterkaempfera bronchialis TaxID=2126346 RepID=UPI003C2E64DC